MPQAGLCNAHAVVMRWVRSRVCENDDGGRIENEVRL